MRDALKQVLKKSKMDSKSIDDVLNNPLNGQIFTMAFTHKSVDSKNNYERLEFYGDAVIKLITVTYISKRWPEMSHGDRTSLSQRLYSKPELARICMNLGLDKYIKTEEILNLSTKEDTLEALFGAITIIYDSAFCLGTGYIVCYRIMESIWDLMAIDTENLTPLKTQYKQMYMDKLGWKAPQLGGGGEAGTTLFKRLNAEKIYPVVNGEVIKPVKGEFIDKTTVSTGLPVYLFATFTPDGALIALSISHNRVNTDVYTASIEFMKEHGMDDFLRGQTQHQHIPVVLTEKTHFNNPKLKKYFQVVNGRIQRGLTYTNLIENGNIFPIIKKKFQEMKNGLIKSFVTNKFPAPPQTK